MLMKILVKIAWSYNEIGALFSFSLVSFNQFFRHFMSCVCGYFKTIICKK